LRFTNYGASSQFFTTTLGTATTISSIAFQDHAKGLCYSVNIANNNRISRSMDGGATWSVLSQQPGNTIGWNIAAVPGSPGFYVLVSNLNLVSGKVAITKNFGDSWSVENINQNLNSVMFTSPSSGWAGGGKIISPTQPAMFKYTGPALVDTKAPQELSGFWVSPNPATDFIRFDFDGAGSGNPVAATLTDLSGRTVFSGKISNKQMDVSQLASGAYFLKIETDYGVAVRKIVRQ
jgi:hypothetical protein